MSRYSVSRPRLTATNDFGLLPGAWADNAACNGDEYPDAWTPGDNPVNNAQMTAYALGICKGCPVKAECLQFALEVGPSQAHGTWGATTADQRKRMWKARGTAA